MYTTLRRTLLPLVLLVALRDPCIAQQSGLGIKAGAGISRLASGAYSTRGAPAGTVGLYLPLLASPRFELQPELLLTALGAVHATAVGAQHTTHQFYLQIPLVAKVYASNCLNLQLGVQAAKLLRADLVDQEGSRDITEEHRPDEIALVFGVGADLRSGVDLTLRYHNGMTPVLANDDVLFPRNRALLVSIGYRMVSFSTPSTQRRRR